MVGEGHEGVLGSVRRHREVGGLWARALMVVSMGRNRQERVHRLRIGWLDLCPQIQGWSRYPWLSGACPGVTRAGK